MAPQRTALPTFPAMGGAENVETKSGTAAGPARAAIGAEPGPRRGLPPGSGSELYDRAYWLWDEAWNYNERHDLIAGRWALLDIWARLILAVVAALSAITLLQEQAQLALVFALVTAVLSAVNAALEPSTRSRAARLASHSFRHIERSAGQLLGAVRARRGTAFVGTSEQGRYIQVEPSPAELREFGDRLVALEAEVDEVLDKAPPINRLRSSRPRYPHTRWGVRRMRGRLARQKEVDELFAAANRQAPLPVGEGAGQGE